MWHWSAELFDEEIGGAPWTSEAAWREDYQKILKFVRQQTGAWDVLLLFDGRSRKVGRKIEDSLEDVRNLSDLWVVYLPDTRHAV